MSKRIYFVLPFSILAAQLSPNTARAQDAKAPAEPTESSAVEESAQAEQGETPEGYASQEEAEELLRVSNGTAAQECEFPGVVRLSGCTGALIHPQVVLYAAHCGRNRSVTFGHMPGKGVQVAVKECKTNPAYRGAERDDWAYCVLAQPMTDIPVTPIANGCELSKLRQAKTEVVQCGFGRSNDGGPTFGRMRYGKSQISRVAKGEVYVNDTNGVVACPGDSGGPLLGRLDDGSWRTIGITSTYNGTCGKGGFNTYADASQAISWIEKSSGIDITPCFDSQGKWEPGPECGKFFAADIGQPSGSLSDRCEGTSRSSWSEVCGEPYADAQDEEPSVEIVKPGDNKTFKAGDKVIIQVEAEGDEDIDHVELFVNGKSKGKDKKSPYSWTLRDLEEGSYKLRAYAVDEAENQGESEEVTFKVTEDDESDEDSSEKENSSDESGEDSSDEDKKKDDDDSSDEDSDEESGEDSSDKKEDEDCEGPASGKNNGKKKKSSGSSSGKKTVNVPSNEAKDPRVASGCGVTQTSSPGRFGAFGLLLGGLAVARRRKSRR